MAPRRTSKRGQQTSEAAPLLLPLAPASMTAATNASGGDNRGGSETDALKPAAAADHLGYGGYGTAAAAAVEADPKTDTADPDDVGEAQRRDWAFTNAFIASTGNVLEWFDFAVFAAFAPEIGRLCVPPPRPPPPADAHRARVCKSPRQPNSADPPSLEQVLRRRRARSTRPRTASRSAPAPSWPGRSAGCSSAGSATRWAGRPPSSSRSTAWPSPAW